MRSLGQSLIHRGGAPPPPDVTTPDEVANLAAWYKADALSLADGAAVAAWPSSGPGPTLEQAVGSQQPHWQAAWRRGLPAVVFDGVDDALAGGGVSGLPLTVLMVFEQSAWGLSNHRMLLSGDDGQLVIQQMAVGLYPDLHAAELQLHQTTETGFKFPLFSAGLLVLTGAPGVDGLTTFTGRVNEGSSFTRETFDAGLNSMLVLGASFEGVSNGPLVLAELAIYSRVLNATEQTALRAYFNDRYALW